MNSNQLNQQPPEKIDHDLSGRVEIVDIWPTMQGEGPYAGLPAVFIRTAGCNLQCPACDTNYTRNRRWLDPYQISTRVKGLRNQGLVVITGGEPFRQNITPMVNMLLNTGYQVQIETNGTYFLEGFPYSRVCVVCSPKTKTIQPKLKPDYYKYVLDADHIDEKDGLPTNSLGMEFFPARPRIEDNVSPSSIYVQPMDAQDEEKTTRNLEAAVGVCFKHGYRVCLQLHKILGLP